MASERIAYGPLELQYGELHRANGDPRGTLVLIHGGFWRWDPEYMHGPAPLAEAFRELGWGVWRPEYRSVGSGGGWPATLDDVGAAIDHLAELGLADGPVVVAGHSAGGHLAVWSTTRDDARVFVRGAISLAGVLDLGLGYRQNLGRGAVAGLLGGSPSDHPARYAAADPAVRITSAARIRIVHGTGDRVVPISQAETYVAAALAAGQDVALTPCRGGHGVVIDPRHRSFALTRAAVEELTAAS